MVIFIPIGSEHEVASFLNAVFELVKPYLETESLWTKIGLEVQNVWPLITMSTKADDMCQEFPSLEIMTLINEQINNPIPLIIFTEDIACAGCKAAAGCANE